VHQATKVEKALGKTRPNQSGKIKENPRRWVSFVMLTLLLKPNFLL